MSIPSKNAMSRMSRIHMILGILLSAILNNAAIAFVGSGYGVLEDKLKVKSCGSASSSDVIQSFDMKADGTWSMNTLSGTYLGTYTELKAEKQFSLAFQSSSYASFISTMVSKIDGLCGQSIGAYAVTDTTIKKFSATINRKKNILKLQLKLSASAQTVSCPVRSLIR